MNTILSRLTRFNRGRAGLLAGLSLVAYCLAAGLSSVAHGLDATLALTVAGLGLGLGWGVGLAGWRPLWSMALLTLAGVATVVIRVSGQALPLLHWAGDWLSQSIQRWPDPTVLPDPSGLVLSGESTAHAMAVVVGRLGPWLEAVLAGQPVVDPAAAAMIWALAIWLAVAWSGWWTTRDRRTLVGLVPALALLLPAEAFASGPWWPIGVGLVGMLISLAFGAEAPVEGRARAGYIDMPEGLAVRLGRIALPLAIGLAGVGVLAPSISVETWVDQYRAWRLASSQGNPALVKSLGVEAVSRSSPAVANLANPGLPNRHLIGSGPELSRVPVMQVTVQLPPGEVAPAPYYWKSLTYDEYTGHGWATSETQTTRVATGQKYFRILPGPSQTLHEGFQLVPPSTGQIYAGGALIRLDRPGTAVWRTPGEDLFGVTASGANYQVDASWPVFSEESLRQDSLSVPDGIRRRYATLPGGVPQEVLALARDLTAAQPTEFDQAKAIESYLRTLPYSLEVPLPPVSGDIVDYFLFQLKTGYCDYYASAMVVLARSVGIPARIAVGYATGQATQIAPGRIRYNVTAADSHTWVEVYFGGVGWVPFEPTAGRPALDQVEAPLPTEPEGTNSAAAPGPGSPIPGGWGWLVALLALAGGLAAWGTVDQVRLSRLAADEQVRTLLQRHQKEAGRWLKLSARVADTPNEYEGRFRAWAGLPGFLGQGRAERLGAYLHSLVSSVNQSAYGPQNLTPEAVEALRRAWPRTALEMAAAGSLGRVRTRVQSVRGAGRTPAARAP
jgi:transglutaminase-like putative cysteine protease